MTAIGPELGPLLVDLPTTAVVRCAVAQGLVVLPDLAASFGISDERDNERSIRPVSDILGVLWSMDDRPLTDERAFSDRVVGTCRHFAVLACAHRSCRASADCG